MKSKVCHINLGHVFWAVPFHTWYFYIWITVPLRWVCSPTFYCLTILQTRGGNTCYYFSTRTQCFKLYIYSHVLLSLSNRLPCSKSLYHEPLVICEWARILWIGLLELTLPFLLTHIGEIERTIFETLGKMESLPTRATCIRLYQSCWFDSLLAFCFDR